MEMLENLPQIEADRADAHALSLMLARALRYIQLQQLSTGELPSYRRAPNGKMEYCFSPFVTTFVHDALACFDPHSAWFEASALAQVAEQHRHWFVRSVSTLRKRMRALIAWQEDAQGTWRFFGHGSGVAPDAATTACAATVLLERRAHVPARQWQAHAQALRRFRSADGLYFSRVEGNGRGDSGMNGDGKRIIRIDRIVNANVLRFLALVGGETIELVKYLQDELAGESLERGSPEYPNPLCFFYVVARAWQQAYLPEQDHVSRALTPHLLSLQADDGSFGGPLSTALALSTMLDLHFVGAALERTRQALAQCAQPWGGWGYEDFLSNGFGSPAWTTALAMSALARAHAVA